MPDMGTAEKPPDAGADTPLPKAKGRTLAVAGIVLAILLAIILVTGTASRVIARRSVHAVTQAQLVPTVEVVHPRPLTGTTLTLPARLEAWAQAPVYARTNGYLRRWYVDIGTRVQMGQVLGEIETPEVDQQLAGSQAALATAQAQLSLAATTATRWTRLLAQNAVSKQDADDRTGDYKAKLAMRNQAQAEVNRLRALTGFSQVVAPFDGVVTARATDVGALIVAGPGGSQPLFTISDLGRLRIYVNVPQIYLAGIKPGLAARFSVPDLPGRRFQAVIDRTAQSVDPQSGAMLVELVVNNPDGLLKPGGYAEIVFNLPSASDGGGLVQVPADALLFRNDGTTVAVVDKTGLVTIRKVSIAVDLGTALQISSGLTRNDEVINNPSDGIETGDRVQVKQQRGD